MNDHVHILVMRTKHKIEYLVGQFKAAATRALRLTQTPWTRGCWKVFINTDQALHAAARYIEQNPVHAQLPEIVISVSVRPSRVDVFLQTVPSYWTRLFATSAPN